MPKRKQTKSKEEKLAENFFPIDETSVSRGIEKQYKKPDYSTLEKVEKQGIGSSGYKSKYSRKKTTKRTSKKKTTRPKSKITREFSAPEISLKSKGYELIITEKPQAALKIASALGKSTKRNQGNIPYYEVDRKGKKIIVACAVGHLFTLSQTKSGSSIPEFEIQWFPNYMVRKKDFTKRYYDVLAKLVKGASEITVATDYDVEGEVIGINVVRFIAGQPDAERMKFSTLTEKDLNEAYESKSPSIDWGQAIAGEARHYLDWFYGINLSRALMNAIKKTGSFRIFSIGRVQGPALNLIVKKEKEIQAFKPKKYWQVFTTLENPEIELIYEKDIFDKKLLKKFENIVGKTGQAETKKTSQSLPPNVPFNLTGLQTEAYSFHGITPSRTLQAAQSLYLAGLISYPRTSSQKLPPSINYREILKTLAEEYGTEKKIARDKPIEGKKSDPAHPSIYPTGQKQILSGDEEKIYNLIARRFLALFMDDAIIDNKTIKVTVEDSENNDNSKSKSKLNKISPNLSINHSEAAVAGDAVNKKNTNRLIFIKKGSAIRTKGWLSVYPKKIKETDIPDISGNVKIASSRTEEKETQPPKRYSPASIVSELEKRNLGTKATRSSILETLYDRGYIQDQSIKATALGISMIETLEKHSPIIIDENLTRDIEKEMESIQRIKSKKTQEEKERKIIEKSKEMITEISKQFKEQENEIGKELLGAQTQLREQEREANKLNVCPLCKKGHLGIMYSRKTKRSFVACDAYPDCRNTYSLPPNSLIKKAKDVCEECGFQKLISIRRGKRPWIFCFNPECETNVERLKEYREKKAKEETAGDNQGQ